MGPSRYDHLSFLWLVGGVHFAVQWLARLASPPSCGGVMRRDTPSFGNGWNLEYSALKVVSCLAALQGWRLRCGQSVTDLFVFVRFSGAPESFRAISTARLNPSPGLHLPPINVVVSDGPQARSYLAAGFALRCFQRLSLPDAATRRCPWRDSRHTGGLSITVLSY